MYITIDIYANEEKSQYEAQLTTKVVFPLAEASVKRTVLVWKRIVLYLKEAIQHPVVRMLVKKKWKEFAHKWFWYVKINFWTESTLKSDVIFLKETYSLISFFGNE